MTVSPIDRRAIPAGASVTNWTENVAMRMNFAARYLGLVVEP